MRRALVLVPALIATRVVSAQPAEPTSPPPPPTDAPAPAPAPSPPPPPPGDASASAGAPAPTEGTPKPDPAYAATPEQNLVSRYVVRYTPDRSRQNVMLMAVLGGAGAVFGAIGLYFHFDSRSSSDKITAQRFTGHAWTEERQQLYNDAHSSRNAAIAMYSIGGALVLTTAIIYMVTEPDMVENVIEPRGPAHPTALVTPTRGGALVGGSWRF